MQERQKPMVYMTLCGYVSIPLYNFYLLRYYFEVNIDMEVCYWKEYSTPSTSFEFHINMVCLGKSMFSEYLYGIAVNIYLQSKKK